MKLTVIGNLNSNPWGGYECRDESGLRCSIDPYVSNGLCPAIFLMEGDIIEMRNDEHVFEPLYLPGCIRVNSEEATTINGYNDFEDWI